MKHLITIITIVCASMIFSIECNAQKEKFDPARFQTDLEQFIVITAGLTPRDAAVFFPLYREYRDKQRVLFDQMRRYHHVDTHNDWMCAQAIKKMDELEIEIKKLQKTYHEKFQTVLPPGIVMKVIQAEGRFHRHEFKRIAKEPQVKPNKK